MKKYFYLLLTFFFTFCSEKTNQEPPTSAVTPVKNIQKEIKIDSSNQTVLNKSTSTVNEESACVKYWRTIYPNDSTRKQYLELIIKLNDSTLTYNNRNLLKDIINTNKTTLKVKQPLFPIFRLNKSHIGIIANPIMKEENEAFIDVSSEFRILEDYYKDEDNEDYSFKPQLSISEANLKSYFANKSPLKIWFYSLSNKDSTFVTNLIYQIDECIEYYSYGINLETKSDSSGILFGSSSPIDLVFETNNTIDSILSNNKHLECLDCPNSTHLQKTFAKLKGTNNLYFVYADTFPINDQLDEPARALIYLNNNQEIIFLWHDNIDLFGCSCL